MRVIAVLEHKFDLMIIQYFMIEFQDSVGRLIVVLSMRVRHYGTLAYVFVDGRKVAGFPSVGEAARHARSLAQGAYVEQSGLPPTLADD